METCDVVIVGAGPYGLSAAAHLRTLKGLDIRIFGEPMAFWERMTVGMCLHSCASASHIADPTNRLSLDAYHELNGKTNGHCHWQDPPPIVDFIKYGQWFHQESGSNADRRKVARVDAAACGGYELILEDGEMLCARRVVVATGIQPFAYRPEMFEGLPPTLVTHTSEHTDYRKFRGKEVIVVGAGRSALEAAKFLEQSGAHAEVLIRKAVARFLTRPAGSEAAIPRPDPILFLLKSRLKSGLKSNAWRRIFYGRGQVGPAGISLVVQRPNLFRRLPRRIQDAWQRRSTRPEFSIGYLPCINTPVLLGRWIVRIRAEGSRLRVSLNDGVERTVDHVVLGTGYRVNVAQYDFLSPRILEKLDVVDGYPRLDSGFESSLVGLHFLGAPAAWSFGPLLRFVAGTGFASRALMRRILGSEEW